MPHVSRTEEPLSDYTAEEFESWVVARLRVEDAWDAQLMAPLRPFNIVSPVKMGPTSTVILPGRRWIEHQCSKGWIYEVKLQDYCYNAILKSSSPLLSFNVSRGSQHSVAVLDGENVVYVRKQSRNIHDQDRTWLTIYHYRGGTSLVENDTPLDPLELDMEPGTTEITTGAISLPSDCVLVITRKSLEIYDYSQIRQDTNTYSKIYPTYRLDVDLAYPNPSALNPVSVQNERRIIFHMKKGTVFGLAIPNNPIHRPAITYFKNMEATSLPSSDYTLTWSMGYRHSIKIHEYGRFVELFEHDWDNPNGFRTRYLGYGLLEQEESLIIAVSEERGRLFIMRANGKPMVYDILCLSE